MLKKFFHLTSLLLITSIFLLTGVGCKGLSKEDQIAVTPVTLEYWTVYDDVETLQPLIDKYVAERPYLTVKLKQLRPEELYPRLIEALADDRGPDIVSIRNSSMFAMKNRLAPMPSVIKDATMKVVRGTINTETVVNRINRPALNVNRLENEYVRAVKGDVVMDGKIYGLPLSVDTLAVFYNKDLLDRAQIAEPPKTWEDFQKMMEKLTKYDKDGKIVQSGTALGTGNNVVGFDDLLFTLFKQSGLDFVDKDGRPVFQQIVDRGERGIDAPSMQVLNFYTDFANPNRKTYSWNENMTDSLEKFVNGSVAFFFGYSYHFPVIKARSPQLNLGVLPLFQLNPDNPANAANYWVQTVTAKSRHQDVAWSLIDYLAHSNTTKEYLDKTGRPSSLRMYVSQQLEKPELAPFVSQVLVADSWYRGTSYDTASKALADMVHEWLLPIPENEDSLGWKQKTLNRAAAKIDQTL